MIGRLHASRILQSVVLGLALALVAVLLPRAAAGAAGKVKVIKLGYDAELSGTYASYGPTLVNAAKLAVNQINHKGIKIRGTKYKMKLLVCNDFTKEADASACATKFVKDDHIKFMFGALGFLSPIVMKVTDPAHVIYFSSSTAISNLLKTNPYTIQTDLGFSSDAKVMVKAIAKLVSPHAKVAMIGPKTVDTTTLFPDLQKSILAAGMKTVAVEKFAPSTTDLTPEVTAAKAGNPTVLIAGDDVADLTAIGSANRSISAAKTVYGFANGCISTVVSQYPNVSTYLGYPLTGVTLSPPANAKAKAFDKLYLKHFPGKLPSVIDAIEYNYTFFGMLAQAISKAKTATNTKKILHTLEKITYSGLEGKIKILSTRTSSFTVEMCKVVNGHTTDYLFKP